MIKLAEGYELILGSSIDAQFGPVLLFGTGGQLVEVFKDRALGLPPLNTTLARRLMEQTQIYHVFRGVRGRKPIDVAALEQLLVRLRQLAVQQPRVAVAPGRRPAGEASGHRRGRVRAAGERPRAAQRPGDGATSPPVAGRPRREAAAHHGGHPAAERGDAAPLREGRLPPGTRLPRG